MSKKNKLERRRDAAQATLDRYKNGAFSFEDGRDCAKMISFHLRQMGLKLFPMSKVQAYKTPLQARAALKAAFGVDNMLDLMDTKLERIPPAMAIVGDIIAVEGEGPLGALTIALGNDLVLAYHEDYSGIVVGRLQNALAAWRTLPL